MTIVTGQADAATQSIALRCNAWYGDSGVDLTFPAHWNVQLLGGQVLPEMTEEELVNAIRMPIGTKALGELAAGRKSAAILVDDLDRPTPVNAILSHTIQELTRSGMDSRAIKVIICGGTHYLSKKQSERKLGGVLPPGVEIMQHNCHQDQVYVGKSEKGTPVWVNQAVYESDLKIGIGCILPHPAAGFSGGSKLLVLGAGGYDTIRTIHDQRQPAGMRGGSIDSEFRQDIEQIAEHIGLDFILNVVINQHREINRLFCGHPRHAFEQGAAYVKNHFRVPSPPENADIIIADFYPCDTTLQQGFDRGLWPLLLAPVSASKVILAGCPGGSGRHELFPVSNPFMVRLMRRLRHLRWADFLSLGMRLRALKRTVDRRKMEVFFFSPGLSEEEARTSLPKSKVFLDWGAIQEILMKRHAAPRQVNVVVYRCAPLMLPETRQG